MLLIKFITLKKKFLIPILFVTLFNNFYRAQFIPNNNSSIHLSYFNPAFCGINSLLNKNYLSNGILLSAQSNGKYLSSLINGQLFFKKINCGFNMFHANNYSNQKLQVQNGFGIAYQLLFFNSISTAWGINVKQTINQDIILPLNHIYADIAYTKTKFYSYSLNLGMMLNYENWMFGYSNEPNILIFNSNSSLQNYFTNQNLHFKYKNNITRQSVCTIWYNWQHSNNIKNYGPENINSTTLINSHSVNIHLNKYKSFVFGVGTRNINTLYYSYQLKLGYNFKNLLFVYGFEGASASNKYVRNNNEISLTLNLTGK